MFTQQEFLLAHQFLNVLERIATALEVHNEEVASRYTVLSTLETSTSGIPATPGQEDKS